MQQFTVTGMQLRRLQRKRRKSGQEGPRRHVLRREPAHQFHGRGRHGRAFRHRQGCRKRGLRRKRNGRGQEAAPSRRRRPKRARGPARRRSSREGRLIASVIFLLVLMYFSMGHMMWGWPLPGFYDGQPCGHGPDAAAADGHHHGHQPEIFHQRLQEPSGTARPIWTRSSPSARRRRSCAAPTRSLP